MTALPKVKTAAPVELSVAGQTCWLDHSGAMLLAADDTLVVADLHLEKGAALARRGMFLPPYDTASTLAALADAVARLRPRRVIALGDSFHDRAGPRDMSEADRASLSAVQRGLDWTWISGNHDPDLPQDLGGTILPETSRGDLAFRHEPLPGQRAEIAGHLHPAARVVLRGRGVRCRAFITDGTRCVMPAFGAYAGGLNVCDPVFEPLFPNGFMAFLIGSERIYAVSKTVLCGD